MLISFSFQNYRSFRDDACLTMTAAQQCGQSGRSFTVDRRRILGAAGLFGPNGGGKSNLCRALLFLVRCVLESGEGGCPPLETFAGNGEDCRFEIEFIDMQSPRRESYKYGLVLGRVGVREEWLFCRAAHSSREKPLFYRRGLEIQCAQGLLSRRYRDLLAFQEAILHRLAADRLLLSLGPFLGAGPLSQVYAWFLRFDFADLQSQEGIRELEEQLRAELSREPSVLRQGADFLARFDKSVCGLILTEKSIALLHRPGKEAERERKAGRRPESGSPKKEQGLAAASEEGSPTAGSLGTLRDEAVAVPWKEESAGLKTLLLLWPKLRFALEGGSVLVVDGLGGQLHPGLLSPLLRYFSDPRKNLAGAQLLFASHDVWQMYNDTLRQDQVWFVEKEEDSGSVLYSLVDFAEDSRKNYYLRRSGSYARRYMAGEFGAVPEPGE